MSGPESLCSKLTRSKRTPDECVRCGELKTLVMTVWASFKSLPDVRASGTKVKISAFSDGDARVTITHSMYLSRKKQKELRVLYVLVLFKRSCPTVKGNASKSV